MSAVLDCVAPVPEASSEASVAMTLLELPPGLEAVIEALLLDGPDAALLRAMGVAEGSRVRVLRKAPFGGPLQVRVGEAAFALGRPLAEAVRVSRAGRR